MKIKIENFSPDQDTIRVTVGEVSTTVSRDELGQVSVTVDKDGVCQEQLYLGERVYSEEPG